MLVLPFNAMLPSKFWSRLATRVRTACVEDVLMRATMPGEVGAGNALLLRGIDPWLLKVNTRD